MELKQLDGVVTFLIVAALIFGLFIALAVFARELYNYVRSRRIERAAKAAATTPRQAQPRRAGDGRERAAAPHGGAALTHDAFSAGHAAGAATHAAGESSGVPVAAESSSGSWGELSGGGYEGSSSGGGDYGGGGDFGGGGGGGGWS